MIIPALNVRNSMIPNGAYWMFLTTTVLNSLSTLLTKQERVGVILTAASAGTGNILKPKKNLLIKSCGFCLMVFIATARFGSTGIMSAFAPMDILLFIMTLQSI